MTRFGRLFVALLIAGGALFFALLRFDHRASRSPAPLPPVVAGGYQSGFVIPVAGVAAVALTDTFRDPRTGHVHGAIDIMAPRGTAVLAATSGTVEKLFESRAGGHTLYLRTPDGAWITYYAHLDSYAAGVREGRFVRQGETIARVGSTGDADRSAPHLHFEVKAMRRGERWYQGRAIDPYPLLAGGPAL